MEKNILKANRDLEHEALMLACQYLANQRGMDVLDTAEKWYDELMNEVMKED